MIFKRPFFSNKILLRSVEFTFFLVCVCICPCVRVYVYTCVLTDVKGQHLALQLLSTLLFWLD